jgi:hypothetical protein
MPGYRDKDQIVTEPNRYFLAQNYPNPFNPSTTIGYDLPKQVHLRLVIYDVSERHIRIIDG